MKLLCLAHQLREACELLVSGIPPARRKLLFPCVQFQAGPQGGALCVDAEGVAASLAMPEFISEEAFSFVVPSERLVETLGVFGQALLTIVPGKRVRFSADGAAIEQNGLEDSPLRAVAGNLPPEYLTLSPAALVRLIQRTIFGVAEESTRFLATLGVLCEVLPQTLRLVSTDGRRLALAEAPALCLSSQEPSERPTVLSVRALTLLQRVLTAMSGKGDWPVAVQFMADEACFWAGRLVLRCNLVEGRFPLYQTVIPTRHEQEARFQVGRLLTAVRQARAGADLDRYSVHLGFAKGQLCLQARSSDSTRSAQVELPLLYDGPGGEIVFDPDSLVDMLSALAPSEELTMRWLRPDRPALFESLAGDYRYVLMPRSGLNA